MSFRFDKKLLGRGIELASFLVLFFWFISIDEWDYLKYSLAILLLFLVLTIIFDKTENLFKKNNKRRA